MTTRRYAARLIALLPLLPALAPGADRPLDWTLVTEQAGWRPRDSAGEVVFDNKLWILGGWFDSYAAPPRDVWCSADGKTWQRVTPEAPWKHSDLPMTLVFDNQIWLLGGWYNGRLPGHAATSEVWSSSDGVHWRLRTPRAGFSPRLAGGAVVFNNRMWILGGTENYYFGDDASLKNDVWSSADGVAWRQETASAGWSARAYHQAVAHAGKIWVMGGGNYVPKYHALADVWCSGDGKSWQPVTEQAGWHPRLWFSSVVYRDRIWVLGGWSNNPSRNWGDVWHSRDGRDWRQLQSNAVWKARHEHSAWVFQDKLWVAGGHATPLSSEVWSLEVPEEQFQER